MQKHAAKTRVSKADIFKVREMKSKENTNENS